ncbi:endonuclease VII domain-containing protein [Rhodococcus sp. 14-2470-1a]|uniref:endonuclease VII domain-containing protein n=1 Tax=Rhodococcus sp. 14-2470-1a TaxID=2023150 RepID=UPI000B9BC489|nr:endonuclease VII domain-containing protein [Rhodococcus sp. 14-2470-1a]OZF41894.1 hypothetical protein CH292_27185 [Rhodococcus sp. 14-2470-1a]
MSAPERKRCKDCDPDSRRPARYPGPRCATHDREKRKASKERAHARHVERTYGITGELYWALYQAQGGRCFICQRATGKAKRLPVDHDHGTGEVRGLLCGPCNRDVLGHLRHDVAALIRAIVYLCDPPARAVLGGGRNAGQIDAGATNGAAGG